MAKQAKTKEAKPAVAAVVPVEKERPEKVATKENTVPNYAGDRPATVAGVPPTTKTEMPEGYVIGQGGTVTKPTEYVVPGAYHKEPNDKTRYAGLALLEGDTFNGNHYKTIVDLTAAVTEEGAFNVFRGHWPDAIRAGFKVKAVSREEADKLQSEWSKELQGLPKG